MEEPRKRKTLGVLLTYPMDPYLESELAARFRLFRFWLVPPSRRASFLSSNSDSIDAVVCGTALGGGIDAGIIDLLPRLGLVATFSVGFDNVDLEKCREREVRVVNTPDVLSDDVADLAIGLAIGVLRRLCSAERWVREERWKQTEGFELTSKFSGKSVGIVGLGRIGMAIAKRAEAFGCPVSYSSRSQKQGVSYKYFSSILELASNCQILMLACPLTAETYHIINREVIDALGEMGVLINIGRGSIVNEKELTSALLDRRLGGAGLDVFEHEPEPPVELFALNNVVLAPHVGSSTLETCKDMADLVIRNLEAYAIDNPLLTPVL